MKNKLLKRFFVILFVVCMSFFSVVSGAVSASAFTYEPSSETLPITEVPNANYFNPLGLTYGTVVGTYEDPDSTYTFDGRGSYTFNSIDYHFTTGGYVSNFLPIGFDCFSEDGVFRDIPSLDIDDRPFYFQFDISYFIDYNDSVSFALVILNPDNDVEMHSVNFSADSYIMKEGNVRSYMIQDLFGSDIPDSYDGFDLYLFCSDYYLWNRVNVLTFSSFYLRSSLSGSNFISSVPTYYNLFSLGYDDGFSKGYHEGYRVGLEDGGGIGDSSYQDGYNAGLAFSKYGIFYNSKIAYRVLDSDGNIRIPYQLAPLKLTVLNNGLDLTNLGTYLTNLYSDTSYQFDIRIIFGLETSISQLSIRASGQTSFLGNYQLSLGLSEPGKQLIGVSNPDYTYPASFIQDSYGDFKLDFSSNWSNFYDSSIVVTSLTDWRIPNAEVLRNLVLFNLSSDYNNGYKVGYDDGFEEGTSEVDSLIDSAYEDGKKEGNSIGYKDGYGAGLRVGYESTSLNDSIKTFVFSVFESPFQVLESFFTLDFVGFDLSIVIKFVLSIIVVGFVIKWVI